MKKRYFVLAVGLVLLGSAVLGLSYISRQFFNSYYTDHLQKLSQKYQENKKYILADAEVLRQKNPFHLTEKTKNAAAFILQRYPIQYVKEDLAKSDEDFSLQREQKNLLNNDLIKWFKGEMSDQDFLTATGPTYEKLGWVAELENFDHINMSTEKPYKDFYQLLYRAHVLDRFKYLFHRPEIDWMQFRTEVMTYFIHESLKPNADIKVLLSKLRHVARLIQTVPTTDLQLHSLVLLKYEIQLAKKFTIENVDALTVEEVNQMKNFVIDMRSLIQLIDDDEVPNELEGLFQPQFMICGAVETYRGTAFYSDLFLPSVFFEYDLQKKIEKNRQILKPLLAKCGLSEYEPLFEKKSQTYLTLEETEEKWTSYFSPEVVGWKLYLAQTPIVKTFVGSQMLIMNFVSIDVGEKSKEAATSAASQPASQDQSR